MMNRSRPVKGGWGGERGWDGVTAITGVRRGLAKNDRAEKPSGTPIENSRPRAARNTHILRGRGECRNAH